MTRLRRFARWFLDSLPFASYRTCSRHWLAGFEQGRQFERRNMGLQRDARGRFVKVSL